MSGHVHEIWPDADGCGHKRCVTCLGAKWCCFCPSTADGARAALRASMERLADLAGLNYCEKCGEVFPNLGHECGETYREETR